MFVAWVAVFLKLVVAFFVVVLYACVSLFVLGHVLVVFALRVICLCLLLG